MQVHFCRRVLSTDWICMTLEAATLVGTGNEGEPKTAPMKMKKKENEGILKSQN